MPLEQFLEDADVTVPAIRLGSGMGFTGGGGQANHVRYPTLGLGYSSARPGLGGYILSNLQNLAGSPFGGYASVVTGVQMYQTVGGPAGVTEDLWLTLQCADENAGTGSTLDDRCIAAHWLGRSCGTTATGPGVEAPVQKLPFPIYVPPRTRWMAGTASNSNAGATSGVALEVMRADLLPKGTLVIDPAGHGFGQSTAFGYRGYIGTDQDTQAPTVTAGAGAYGTAVAMVNLPRMTDMFIVGLACWRAGGIAATVHEWAQAAICAGTIGSERILAEVMLPAWGHTGVTGAIDNPPTLLSRPLFVKGAMITGGDALSVKIASGSVSNTYYTSLIYVKANEVMPIESVLGRYG